MTLDDALALCRANRPSVEPIPAFITQLKTYEEKCRRLGFIVPNKTKNKTKTEGNEQMPKNKKMKEMEVNEQPQKKRKIIGPTKKPIHYGPSPPCETTLNDQSTKIDSAIPVSTDVYQISSGKANDAGPSKDLLKTSVYGSNSQNINSSE